MRPTDHDEPKQTSHGHYPQPPAPHVPAAPAQDPATHAPLPGTHLIATTTPLDSASALGHSTHPFSRLHETALVHPFEIAFRTLNSLSQAHLPRDPTPTVLSPPDERTGQVVDSIDQAGGTN